MIAIIGAMPEEVDEILAFFKEVQKETIANIDFYRCQLDELAIVICLSGIGKVNSAVSTTILLNTYDVKAIINIGSAGGVIGNIGDVVVASGTQYFDVDVTSFGYEFGQVPGMPLIYSTASDINEKVINILKKANIAYHFGLIASSDSFIKDKPLVSAIAYEMEAASICQVAHKFGVNVAVIRSLSDIINGNNHLEFSQFIKVAAKQSAAVVYQLLEGLR